MIPIMSIVIFVALIYLDKYVKVGISEDLPQIADQQVVDKNIDEEAQVVRLLPHTLQQLNCSAVSSVNNTIGVFRLISCQDSTSTFFNSSSQSNTTIVAVTPTYKRLTQKSDLVTLCQTIMNVPNFLWIVVEDSHVKTALVKNVLQQCKVNSVHLNAVTSAESKRAAQRGVEQRNTGLDWARRYCRENCMNKCNGVLYFMDDDNKYDLRLFQQVLPYYTKNSV